MSEWALRLWELQVIRLTFIPANGAPVRPRNVYLDISSDTQPPRRYYLNSFSQGNSMHHCRSVVHVSATPITLHLSYGRVLRRSNLGVYTLFDFLNQDADHSLPIRGTLTFGRIHIYELEYCLAPVQRSYNFILSEVTCLRQVRLISRDELYAEVECNSSVEALSAGPRNQYHLGGFKSHNSCSVYTANNFIFSTITNFRITFFVKSTLGAYVLGSVFFMPLRELKNNPPPVLVPPPTSLLASVTDKEQAQARFMKQLIAIRESKEEHGLVLIVEGQEALLLLSREDSANHKIVLSSSGVGSYEVVFTVVKEQGMEHITRVSERNNVFLDPLKRALPPPPASLPPSSPVRRLTFRKPTHPGDLSGSQVVIGSHNWSDITPDNRIEVLIDGLETFERYYDVIQGARHSLAILGWEFCLDFGLILASRARGSLPVTYNNSSPWITIEDALLARALEGVKIRILVWRHALFSILERVFPSGTVPLLREAMRLKMRAAKLGLNVEVLHGTLPSETSPYAHPFADNDAHIVLIIVGNPKGLISSHHEKLLMADAECPAHTIACTGGFDIARGRYDTQAHSHADGPPPRAEEDSSQKEAYLIASALRVSWHDTQLLIRGPATQHFHLHFLQRWNHSFTRDISHTRGVALTLPSPPPHCSRHPIAHEISPRHDKCLVRLTRTWKTVFDAHFLLDEHLQLIVNAQHFLFLEHQYPFQNFGLAWAMCKALKSNPRLHLLMILPVKTDLPRGFVGDVIDWSQDHIISNVQMIHSVAPDRVGAYGLVQPDADTTRLRPIYVHSKMAIVDDEIMLTGSTNMDSMSFFHSSEVSVTVTNKALARDTKARLVREHLGAAYKPSYDDNNGKLFSAFRKMAQSNLQALRDEQPLVGRVVAMTPLANYELLLRNVLYPTALQKLSAKLGFALSESEQHAAPLKTPKAAL